MALNQYSTHRAPTAGHILGQLERLPVVVVAEPDAGISLLPAGAHEYLLMQYPDLDDRPATLTWTVERSRWVSDLHHKVVGWLRIRDVPARAVLYYAPRFIAHP